MKTFRTTTGPFRERPYFDLEEIEQICTEELKKVGLFPESPEPIRVERFIEKRFDVSPKYDALQDGILGFTRFGPKGVLEIMVSRRLSEAGDEVSERKLNTTFAHEAGHGLLHVHLFVLGETTGSLFNDDINHDRTKILCRNEAVPGAADTVRERYSGKWWEYQANRAMGSLLLPKSLVEKSLVDLIVPKGKFGRYSLPEDRREAAVELLATMFDVNPVVARYRIGDVYPLKDEKQLTL